MTEQIDKKGTNSLLQTDQDENGETRYLAAEEAKRLGIRPQIIQPGQSGEPALE